FGGDLVARYSVKAVGPTGIESNFSNTVSTNGQSLWKNNDGEGGNNQNNNDVIKEYSLNANYPNPFNPTTQISYQLPEDSFVNLVVYNSLGQEVKTLVNQNQAIGYYTVEFNAKDLPSGIYLYKLASGSFSKVNKMLLLR
ncbi:MAG: T9SS type A sorting domain-containing protein, partial [Bacteroidota bacterium]